MLVHCVAFGVAPERRLRMLLPIQHTTKSSPDAPAMAVSRSDRLFPELLHEMKAADLIWTEIRPLRQEEPQGNDLFVKSAPSWSSPRFSSPLRQNHRVPHRIKKTGNPALSVVALGQSAPLRLSVVRAATNDIPTYWRYGDS